MGVDEVGRKLGRAPSTVGAYLAEYIEEERPASIAPWVDDATYAAIAQAAVEVKAERFKPIYERLEGRVSYDQIRWVLAHMRAVG